MRVLMCRFRKLNLRYLKQAYAAGKLHFFGELRYLADPRKFARYLAPLRIFRGGRLSTAIGVTGFPSRRPAHS